MDGNNIAPAISHIAPPMTPQAKTKLWLDNTPRREIPCLARLCDFDFSV